jgi:PAS domain S-box-containing protein
LKFLIVDDNPADRELIIRKLNQAFDGVDFVEVGGPADFEKALAAPDYDVVLSDYYLHWSDGLEIFQKVRVRYPEVPVVMFTDSGNEEVAVAGMKMGLSDYLRKHDLNRLPIAVRESIEKARLQHEYGRTVRRLRFSEERYRAISETISDYAFSYRVMEDGASVGEWLTDAFYRITGYTEDEVAAAGGWTFVLHPDDADTVESHRRRLLLGHVSTCLHRIRTRDGATRWLRVTGRPVWDEELDRVVRVYGAAQDVTEQQQAVAALRTSEARFRTLFEKAALGIAMVGTDRRPFAVNPALARMLGYAADELVGVPFPEFTHPDDVEEDVALYERLLAGDIAFYQVEKRYLHRDGSIVWARLTVSRAEDAGDRPEFVIAMIEDITEERAAQETLIRAEKMALTGTLAASIAHEINNPMQAVTGCLGLATESLESGEDTARAKYLLDVAMGELQRAAGIVTELRDLNRRSNPEDRELTDIATLLDRVLTLSKGEFDAQRVEIRLDVADDLPKVSVVPDRFHQVLLNLILNANQAIRESGVLSIEVSQTEDPFGVQVAVADNGVGISKEDQAQLFQPFFTTRQEGVGLGLYVTRNIVEEHGGTIDVESEMGAGTTVKVWLPAGE